jgi:hypothetical protein
LTSLFPTDSLRTDGAEVIFQDKAALPDRRPQSIPWGVMLRFLLRSRTIAISLVCGSAAIAQTYNLKGRVLDKVGMQPVAGPGRMAVSPSREPPG